MDGARIDRILKGKNYQNLISKSTFFSKCITYAPYTHFAICPDDLMINEEGC